ncbi:MAG: diacylglycerol kinase family protein [Litorilinea sp.]
MPRVYAILNPASGRGRAPGFRQEILNALTHAGLEHELVETTHGGHATELACAARRAGFDVVAAIGGDGTVSEVMNGLYQAAHPDEQVGTLAIFPSGSGNDLVDMLGAPKTPATVAQHIAAQSTRAIDLGFAEYSVAGEIHQRAFDNNLGLGFEAQVTLESYKLRKLRGTLLYITAARRALRAYSAPRLTIAWLDADHQAQTRTLESLMISIGNSARTGGGFYLTPAAILDDGLLDIAIAKKLPRWRVLGLLPKALFGKHTTDSAVEMATCRQVRITCHDVVPMHLDGEVVTEAVEWVDIRVEPRRLRVVA